MNLPLMLSLSKQEITQAGVALLSCPLPPVPF
jgi:hypothetical protein